MPETIKVACPNCSAQLNVMEQHLGKRVKCPKCQQPFSPAIPAAVVNKAGDLTPVDEGTIEWTCPGCFQEYLVHHEGEYDLCPQCESSKTTGRQLHPAHWHCPNCDQYFTTPFDGEFCPACEQLMGRKRLADRLDDVDKEAAAVSKELHRAQSRELGKSADAVRRWSTVMVILGVLSLLGGLWLATVIEKESSIGRFLAISYGVAAIVEAILSFALAAGLSAIGNICERLDQT